ncbi:MAG: hydroxymethylbilane synthase [Geminicoccaceae bacterium]|nr:hydroxymethylbilane synthase [Geminicoccaceae bacterium]
MSNLRIGTRASPLALAQTALVGEALARVRPDLAEPGAVEVVAIRTTGDHILDRPLAQAGGKGLFTKEIEDALLDGRIDLAVHSMKDMPTVLPDGLCIAAMLPRADVRDVLIAGDALSIQDLPNGARLGSASLRRVAQVLAVRPDIRPATLRGSVQTRLKKIEAGAVDATLLARAGLDRLGIEAGAPLSVAEMLPAVAQGAVGVECRAGDERMLSLLERIDDLATSLAVDAERAFLEALDGSCRTPIAGYCRVEGEAYRFEGLVLRPDGSESHRDGAVAGPGDIKAAARAAGDRIRARLDDRFFIQP